jgi:hypothetical protein
MSSLKIKVFLEVTFWTFVALLIWLCVRSTFTALAARPQWLSEWLINHDYVASTFFVGYAILVLMRTKTSSVRLTAPMLASLGVGFLSKITTDYLGLHEWLADGPYWHAALYGFGLFISSVAVTLFFAKQA